MRNTATKLTRPPRLLRIGEKKEIERGWRKQKAEGSHPQVSRPGEKIAHPRSTQFWRRSAAARARRAAALTKTRHVVSEHFDLLGIVGLGVLNGAHQRNRAKSDLRATTRERSCACVGSQHRGAAC